MLRDQGRPRKPWGLQSDGDIWCEIDRASRRKGTGAVALTKLKGHATETDVAEGRTTEAHRAGNSRADGAATTAKTAQRQAQMLVLRMLDARWELAKEQVTAVQNMMLGIIQDTRQRRQQMETESKLSTTHRKAMVEIQGWPDISGKGMRTIRKLTTSMHGQGTSHWQHKLGIGSLSGDCWMRKSALTDTSPGLNCSSALRPTPTASCPWANAGYREQAMSSRHVKVLDG